MKQRELTITSKPGCNPKYPFIIVGGKWLMKYGFHVGGKVLVKCKKGIVHIRAIKFTNQDNINDESKERR